MALYKITTKGDDGKYYAKLPSRTIEMKDDEKYLEYFANGGCVIEFMKNETVWGEDLTKYEGFLIFIQPYPPAIFSRYIFSCISYSAIVCRLSICAKNNTLRILYHV